MVNYLTINLIYLNFNTRKAIKINKSKYFNNEKNFTLITNCFIIHTR
jgi:hypothetical protein